MIRLIFKLDFKYKKRGYCTTRCVTYIYVSSYKVGISKKKGSYWIVHNYSIRLVVQIASSQNYS